MLDLIYLISCCIAFGSCLGLIAAGWQRLLSLAACRRQQDRLLHFRCLKEAMLFATSHGRPDLADEVARSQRPYTNVRKFSDYI